MQVVIDGFFARFEILDNMFALSTANQMAPHVGKKQKKPKELKLFSKKAASVVEGGEQRSAEDDKAAFRRLKQFSKRRSQRQRTG